MRRSVESLPQSATLDEVIKKFLRHQLESMPIVDAAERVAGIVTVHDLIDIFLPRYFDLLRDLAVLEDKGQLASLFDLSFAGLDTHTEKLILAADVMHAHLQWINEDDSLLIGASRLQTQRQRGLPVIDRDGKLVGWVFDYDIVLALLKGNAAAAKQAARS
jgi:CBS-domain-containing membrane protein